MQPAALGSRQVAASGAWLSSTALRATNLLMAGCVEKYDVSAVSVVEVSATSEQAGHSQV